MPITLRCPNPQCGRTLVIPDQYRGQTGTCQFCGMAVHVPGTVDGPPIPPPPGTYADARPSSGGRNTWVIVAIVAAVMLVVCIGGCLVMSAITGPVFMKARGKARQTSCLSNMKQLAVGTLMYAQDNGNVYPQAPSWLTDIQPYVKVSLSCPAGAEYVMNPRVSGQPLAAIMDPSQTVLAYEARGGQPAFVHEGSCNVAFCDGHARAISESQKANCVW